MKIKTAIKHFVKEDKLKEFNWLGNLFIAIICIPCNILFLREPK